MTSRTSIIFTFILATILVTGTVELFYRSFNKAIRADETPLKNNARSAAISPPQKTIKQTGSAPTTPNNNYTIITQRNLFGNPLGTTSTTPFSRDPILDTTSLDLVLLGTIKGSADSQRAIIRNKKSKKQDIYGKGDSIDHAIIKEIMRGKIILTVNGNDEVLLMGEIKSPPAIIHKAPSAPKKDNNLQEAYTEDTKSPPAAVPKRRLTLQSKKQPAEE